VHMSDALVSPGVGGAMWAASAGLAAWSARRLREEMTDARVQLMGVLGAFVFAAQMVNFAIPGTGSSGHLAGGLLLAILLGPHAAFLAMFSILTVQALFFADGGLLALGCNAFNLGFWPCFVVYPLVFRRMVGDKPGRGRLTFAAVLAGAIGLQLGAFGVVLQTLFSGISELPFGTFALLMQPIHLAIGIVEGLVTAALLAFVWKARPELVLPSATGPVARPTSMRPVLVAFAALALVTGGLFSWFASTRPDGLEWSSAGTCGREEPAVLQDRWHRLCAGIQEWTAFLPGYDFKSSTTDGEPVAAAAAGTPEAAREPEESGAPHPAVSSGTSLSGVVGGAIVLALIAMVGLGLRLRGRAEQAGG